MTMIFRLLWIYIYARIGPRCSVTEETRLPFRCWFTDLDVNMHMTNTRYASFMDLGRMDMLFRSGAWKRMRAVGIYPVLGSATVRFRKSILPLQKFELTTRIASWDDKWVYYVQTMVVNGEAAGIGIVKKTFLDKNGRVPMEKIIALLGYDAPKPPITPLIDKKNELDVVLKA